MLAVVSPVLHSSVPLQPVATKVAEDSWQITWSAPALTVGKAVTVTLAILVSMHPPPAVLVMTTV